MIRTYTYTYVHICLVCCTYNTRSFIRTQASAQQAPQSVLRLPQHAPRNWELGAKIFLDNSPPPQKKYSPYGEEK